MSQYVQQFTSQIELTFSGIWALPVTTLVDITKQGSIYTIQFPELLNDGAFSANLLCQLPSYLIPSCFKSYGNSLHYIGPSTNAATAGQSLFVLDGDSLLTIYSGTNFEPFSGTDPNGIYAQNMAIAT